MLGLVIIAGARRERDGLMRFSPRLPNDTATLLLVASFIIVLIGLAVGAHDPASHHIKTISIVGAAAILVVYGLWMRQYLTTEPATDARAPARRGCRPRASLVLLVAAGVAVGIRVGLVRPRAPADDPHAPASRSRSPDW